MKKAVVILTLLLGAIGGRGQQEQVIYKDKPLGYWVDQIAAGDYGAREAFEKLHCKAAPAVPRLVELLNAGTSKQREYAAHVLGKIGVASALPPLVQRLASPDRYDRHNACGAILDITFAETSVDFRGLGPAQRCTDPTTKPSQTLSPCIEPLINLLADNDDNIVSCASVALARMGPMPVKKLVASAQDVKVPVPIRAGAARVLGKIGPAAIDALPALKALVSVQAEDALIRGEAHAAILKIERRSE